MSCYYLLLSSSTTTTSKVYVLQIHTFLKSQHIFPSHTSNGIKKKHYRIFLLKYSVFITILFFFPRGSSYICRTIYYKWTVSWQMQKKFPEKIQNWQWGALKSFIHRGDESSQPPVHATVTPAPWQSHVMCHMNMTQPKKIRTKAIY